MDLWLKVLLVQAVICAVAVAAGRAIFGTGWKPAILAALMVTPVPLFKISAGAAGFVYVPDVIATLYLMRLAFLPSEEPLPKAARSAVFWATVCLVILPLLSTALGWPADPAARSWKTVALGIGRGMGYVAVFHLFIRQALAGRKQSDLTAVQIIIFTLICVSGVLQHLKGIDFDLWNAVRGLDSPERFRHNLGGGFMGLYRGAVGAWAVGFLALIPVVTATRRWMIWIMPVCVTCILGGVLVVGSRQGAVIGLLALVISFLGLSRIETHFERVKLAMKAVVGLGLIGCVALFAWQHYATPSMQAFVVDRFASLTTWNSAVETVEDRMSVAPIAWDHIKSNSQMFLVGAGYGGEDDDGVASSPVRVILLDSEFLYVWQLGGIVLILAYAGLAWKLRKAQEIRTVSDVEERALIIGARVTLYSGLLLTYGHFFILTVSSAEAPIAYWIWSIFGASIGVSLRSHIEAEPAYQDDLVSSEEPFPPVAVGSC